MPSLLRPAACAKFALAASAALSLAAGYPNPERFPSPPSASTRWNPPVGTDRNVVEATDRLFRLCLPDPRGCEYRAVTVTTGPNGGDPVETAAWLLPEPNGDPPRRGQYDPPTPDFGPPRRHAICWNGQIHPVKAVGGVADPVADARLALAVLTGSPDPPPEAPASVRVDAPHPIRIALLLRTGETDLAGQFFAAAYEGEAGGADRFFADAAAGWAQTAFDRLYAAHLAGDRWLGDAVGNGRPDGLGRVIAAAAAEAGRRGPPGTTDRFPDAALAGRIAVNHADRLNRDWWRPMGPPPDATAALFDAVEDVRLDGPPWPGGLSIDLRRDPTLRALIDRGRDRVSGVAVVWGLRERMRIAPGSSRLTRVVDPSDGTPVLLSTADLATFVLREILGGDLAPDRFAAFWRATRGRPPADRWAALLAEDDAPPAQWQLAAEELSRPGPPRGAASAAAVVDGETAARGGELRSLAARRLRAILDPARPAAASDPSVLSALALLLPSAEPGPDRAVLRDVLRRLWDAVLDPPAGFYDVTAVGDRIGQLTVAAGRAGDREELRRYAARLRSLPPGRFVRFPLDVLRPLWEFPDDPGIAALGEWVFEGTDSPWPAWLATEPPYGPPQPGVRRPTRPSRNLASLIDPRADDARRGRAPAFRLPAFRRMVVRLLSDGRYGGVARPGRWPDGRRYVDVESGVVGGREALPPGDSFADGPHDLRLADVVAWRLSLRYRQYPPPDGPVPALSAAWPVPRRDRALAEWRAWVRGDRPAVEAPRP